MLQHLKEQPLGLLDIRATLGIPVQAWNTREVPLELMHITSSALHHY